MNSMSPWPGITFGDGIPVDGYWDAANQRIVIEEIVPQGGEIVLAGQIISTGNGTLRVANGYTNVNINNESGYDIYIERIDVTKNKVGRIQITDTSTGDGSAADPFERIEYTYSAGQVLEQLYQGTVNPPDPDGFDHRRLRRGRRPDLPCRRFDHRISACGGQPVCLGRGPVEDSDRGQVLQEKQIQSDRRCMGLA